MKGFVDLRCPNRPFPDADAKECRCRLQGPDLEVIETCLRSGVPFRDLRYCTHCKVLWKITIVDLGAPEYELVPRGTDLPLVSETDIFGVIGAAGRKLSRKAKS